ncbi:MAG: AbrB/MazE/SpoVT family DNA-binding domain-containing protein [Ruminococcus sp.]|nr:AbrB/MazE/SpoVT family DNA-binding domain-containing protein [Ruminococcus sp.]
MLDKNDMEIIQQMIQKSVREELQQLQQSEEECNNDSLKSRMHLYHDAIENINKNQRKAKVLFTNAGGSASKGSQTTRITLPITWVRQMGITPENREVDIRFEDGKIIIEKKAE